MGNHTMANLNKVFLMGNLTRDPELRSTQSGSNVCKFGLAVNRKFTTQQGTKEETTFVDLTAFGRQAEVINQYCTKGKPLFVEGRLQFSTWETKEGQKRSKLDVIVENFQFLGQGSGSAGAGGGGGGGGSAGGRGSASSSSGGGDGGFGADDFGADSEIPF